MRVLITGAAGEIGSVLHLGLRGRYKLLRLADLRPVTPGPGEEAVVCDITDPAALVKVFAGIDCVVHLAGVPREDAWDKILPNNIVGTYNVFEAARQAGVRRVVFASSNHTIGYYRVEGRVGRDVPVRPDSRYGVSKVFGEAVGRMYADKYGMSVACLRIGSFLAEPVVARNLVTWLSHGDMVELARAAIEAPKYHFVVVYGVSANTRACWDSPDAQKIGYRPRDNAEDYVATIAGKTAPPGPEVEFHGGPFCALEFTGNATRID
jgi:uronate dehydrogenase